MVRVLLATVVLGIALFASGCREQSDIKIHSLKFNGVKAVPQGQLRNALQTKQGSKLPWGQKRYFDRRAFEADLKRIQAYYHDRGFPDARVTSFDVKLNDKQDQVDLTINISEGQPVLVSDIVIEGADVLPPRDRERLRTELPLQPHRPLDRQQALASRERVTNGLKDAGYPYAEVAMTEDETAPRQVRVVFRAAPGPIAYFGPVEIGGQKSVDEYVIRRHVTYKPGERFTRTKMRETQRRLYGLELFQFVNVESREDREQQPTTIPTRITVAEGKHRKVTFGVGYGSEEKARARVRWDHVNFFGGARHAGFEGRWSSLDRGVRADFTEPYFLTPHLSLRFDGQAWQSSEPAFSANTVGGRMTVTHEGDPRNKWSVALINEYQRSRISNAALTDFSLRDELISLGLDPRTGQQDGTLSALAFDIQRDTTGNILDARRGYFTSGHVEQAGRILWGTFNYLMVQGEARYYVTVLRRAVIATRLGLGSIDPASNNEENVPFHKRYFLGGATSLRGWGRFEVSPLSGAGLTIGGLSRLEGSTEVRMPVWGKLGLVAFVDYGNVWDKAWKIDPNDLRYDVGPGLRYLTPIGPARFDVGYQLNPVPGLLVNGEPQKRQWRIHFSIGQAF